jgi:sec-independent protein translocase protein TatA
MFLFIGTPEIILVLVIMLLLFGPEKIPEIAKGLGKGIRMLRDTTTEVKREILKESYELEEGKKNLASGIEKEVKELKKIMDVKEDIKDLTKGLDDLKGPVKRK